MPLEKDPTLVQTKTVQLLTGALRRSLRRFSLMGRKKLENNIEVSILEIPITDTENNVFFVPEPSDYRIRSKEKDNLARVGSFRLKQRPTFTSRNQPLVQSSAAIASIPSLDNGNTPDQRKLTSFEKRRRQNQDYAVALHAKQSLFCPEQASQIELEIITLTNRDFIVQISAPNGEKSPPLYLQTSGLPARFSPSNVGCGHGLWRLEVFEREQAKFVPRHTKELNLRGCGLLVFEVLRAGELRLFDRLWLDVID